MWIIDRILISEKYSETLHSISKAWTLDDLVRANDLLDAIDDAEHEARKRQAETR